MHLPQQIIPNDLRRFLSVDANLTHRWGRPYPVEIIGVQLYSLADLSFCDFEVCTAEYYLNYNEAGEDPDLAYHVRGINLVQEVEDHDAMGLFVWFPQFQEYGSYEPDHAILTMLPAVTWKEIEKDPAKYFNAQWYPDRVNHYLLRPWADNRCADILPRPRK